MSETPLETIAGRYELQRRLGTSSAARVFLARDRDLDRLVAVKVLAPDLARNPEMVERFRRASASAATLRDPRIVMVYDWGEQSATPFVAMEYVDGTSLADTLLASPRIGSERAAAIGEQVAEALDVAHRAGVVHGSLTPRDVLLARDGSVKVTDFGTAASGLAGLGDSPVTTAIYASPEQLQGAAPDVGGDLYTLGVILHEAVAGAPPFTGTDVMAITRRKLEERPLPASAGAPGVPPAFDAIVERLLAADVARRYPTAGEVASDLRRLRETVTVPVIAAPAPTAAMPAVPATALPDAEPEKRSKTGWIIAAIVVLALVVGGVIAWLASSDSKSKADRVSVPAVVGQPVLAAQNAITTAGLSASTINEANVQFGAGLVFSQSPSAATKAARGSVVVLKVSTGPPPTSSTSTSTTSTSSTTTSTTTTTIPPTTTTTIPPTSSSSAP